MLREAMMILAGLAYGATTFSPIATWQHELMATVNTLLRVTAG